MSGGVLVIGYGNPLRRDDGLGSAVAGAVATLGLPGVRVLVVHQLTPELAADLADARLAVFVDAAVEGQAVRAVRIDGPAPDAPPLTHAVDPVGLVALARAVYRRCPEVWLVTVAGSDFGYGEGLSPAGEENVRRAAGYVEFLIREATGA